MFVCRAFDVELLYIAQQLGMPVGEVAVNWKEIEGECIAGVYWWTHSQGITATIEYSHA